MIIDFHTHIFPPYLKNDRSKYSELDPCFASLYSSPKARMATADELITSMDNDGIDISVVLNIGWARQELCVETNDYILESIARFPERLVGFCSLQPLSPEAALNEIERCARQGIKGIGEIRLNTQWLDGGMRHVFEEIIRRNLILLAHASEPVGHQYPGKGDITPGMLYPLITGFPNLTMVCAHWGGGLPFYALMPEVKKALGNTFFDTAASPFLYSPGIYQQVSQLVGADKILFGSDFPLLSQNRPLKEIKSLDLPPETERLILSGNARGLLGIKG